jgi:septal ring factor EnvC (AmiA/AmiB activator)
MQLEIIAAVLSALASLLAGGAIGSDVVRKLVRHILKLPEPVRTETFRSKLDRLSGNLADASREVDAVLSELTSVAKAREEAVSRLEEELMALEQREQSLQQSIKQLENVPLPVVDRFAELTATGERRSARRDYILFASGVIVSTIIAIALRFFGIG